MKILFALAFIVGFAYVMAKEVKHTEGSINWKFYVWAVGICLLTVLSMFLIDLI